MRAARQPARGRFAQGRLRPRARSWPDRAARPARRTWPRMGALRSGAGLVTVATPRSCCRSSRRMAPEYMTEALAETPKRHGRDARVERVLELDADVIAGGPGLGRRPGVTRSSSARCSIARPCRSCSMPMRSTCSPTIPGALVGREGRDVIITPHPGEMARLVGCTVEDVQANRIEVARDFADAHRVYVVLKGHRTLIATPDGQRVHQSDRQSGHGDRRHRRRADRHDRRVARAVARRRSRLPAGGVSCTAPPAISRKRTKARWR